MLLSKLIDKKFIKNDFDVKEIKRDARKVEKGDAFFCFATDKMQAFLRCQQAQKYGAGVCFSHFDIPNCVKVEDVRELFACACANYYHRACDKMKIVGISGTNGKTTTAHIIAEMLKRNNHKVGLIGTNGVFFDRKSFNYDMTTPDADILHKIFFEMWQCGVEYVVMEVSAHAIMQKRIAGIHFEVGVLTNITQDHLDYFETMEKYENAKFAFFTKEHIKKAVVCIDDERAKKVLSLTAVPVITYGLQNPCDCFAVDVFCEISDSSFVANVCDSVLRIKTNLVGKHNVYNSLAALAVCQRLGLGDEEMERGLNFIRPVEGRFNVFNVDGKYVVIDYAHTPDGIEKVIATAKELTDKKVELVFGCGGDRDKTKRAKMGKASELADFVCLTNDNPRTENPEEIISQIEEGMTRPHMVETDRKQAIEKMIDFASVGDIVIIAGKGAEKYQEIGDRKIPYSDFDVLADYCKNKTEEKIKYGG